MIFILLLSITVAKELWLYPGFSKLPHVHLVYMAFVDCGGTFHLLTHYVTSTIVSILPANYYCQLAT